MSISEKAAIISSNNAAIKENVQKVYDAGRESFNKQFWDAFQKNGTRVEYAYAFANGWDDSVYDPKYPIENASIGYLFALSGVTDTKIPISARSGAHIIGFMRYSQIASVRSLDISGITDATNAFQGANELENITFIGTIPKSVNFQWSPLSVASMKNIISCLQSGAGQTLTFSEACWTALEADSAAPDGGTWKDYVTNTKGWIVA